MENKLRTGLPYDFTLMDLIRNEGAVVDMNNVNFPNVPEDNQINVSFIFLRNTDYPVEYDFSECSYEKKTIYLLNYITSAVEYKIDVLIQTWLAACCYSLGIILEDKGIFDESELKHFVEDNISFIGEIIQFLISLPLYAITRYEYDNKKIIIDDDLVVSDTTIFNENINYFLYNNAINIIMSIETIFKPIFYTNYFTDTNNKLFTALQELPYTAMLVAMTEKSPVEWKGFMDAYNEFIEPRN